MTKKKTRKTSEGFIVDEESGEIVEDMSIDFEHPEYRVYNHEDYYRRVHYAPLEEPHNKNRLCIDDESAERTISQIIPGLVELLKVYLRKSLCNVDRNEIYSFLSSLWGVSGAEIVKNVIERKLSMSLFESQAYDLAGLDGLTVFRCLKNAGINENKIIEAIKAYEEEIECKDSYTYTLVKNLLTSIKQGKQNALIRWIVKPINDDIDVEYAARVFNVEPKKLRNVIYIVAKVRGLGVQITSAKVDISSKVNEENQAIEIAEFLSRKLGVEFSKPIPMIATIVIKMPFRINLQMLSRFEKASLQGNRVKIASQGYTMLVYPSTINIYASLMGSLNRINIVLAQALPAICTYVGKD